MAYLSGLNEDQKKVVLNYDGPCMVLAGAGSGKTKTIISKIVYLIDEIKIKPYNILGITFTNKAASEMKHRINSWFNGYSGVNLYTFHSFCAMYLRQSENLDIIGYNKNFIIYDDSESNSIIKSLLKRFQEEYSVNEISNYIDGLKNNGFRTGSDLTSFKINDKFHKYYEEYQKELQKSNAMDFGGLIISMLELLELSFDERNKIQEKFKYIMVDEYQDTNKSQFELINILAEKNQNICIVLDIDQSIYSFRDANIKNVMEFEKIYPNYKLIKLEENYRSTKKILRAANAVIENNVFRKEKTLFSSKHEGENIQVVKLQDQNREAEFVGNWVSSLLKKGIKPNEIAIFFRNNAMSRSIEDILNRNRIPYILYGGLKFFDRKEIKDIIAYMKLAYNTNDNQSLKRIINVPVRGIGNTFLSKIEAEANLHGLTIWQFLKSDKISLKDAKKVEVFTKMIDDIKLMIESNNKIETIFNFVLETTGYCVKLEQSTSYEDQARVDNIKEFKSTIVTTDEQKISFADFISNIALGDETKEISKDNCVYLMTIHSAKGLEFEYVMAIGLEENIFPSVQAIKEEDQVLKGVEEERRLFYVCVTRAKKILYLTHVVERMLYGEKKNNKKSRFLDELPSEVVTVTNLSNKFNFYS